MGAGQVETRGRLAGRRCRIGPLGPQNSSWCPSAQRRWRLARGRCPGAGVEETKVSFTAHLVVPCHPNRPEGDTQDDTVPPPLTGLTCVRRTPAPLRWSAPHPRRLGPCPLVLASPQPQLPPPPPAALLALQSSCPTPNSAALPPASVVTGRALRCSPVLPDAPRMPAAGAPSSRRS